MNELYERFRYLLDYNQETGIVTWKPKGLCGRRSGDEIGTERRGYRIAGIDRKQYFVHRVIWLWMTGEWPEFIDHINGKRSDNRWENLRNVSQTTNAQNQRKPHKRSKSGYLGVTIKSHGCETRICVKGKNFYIGTYNTPEEAHEAYLMVKRMLHKGCTI